MKRIVLSASILLFFITGFSQIKVVVLGSSTAQGTGASTYANSWVGRFTTYVQSLNAANVVTNLAVGGYGTNQVMPTGSNVGEVPDHNITKALTYNPNLIILNMPSNDAASGMSIANTMSNFRTIINTALNAHVTIWVSTTQPRNLGTAGQNLLRETKDSLYAQFGSKVIDFYTTIALSDFSIDPTYNSGDGIHLNDAGHLVLFNRVKARFDQSAATLPVYFKLFKGVQTAAAVQLQWSVATANDVIKYDVERSTNGVAFTTIGSAQANSKTDFLFDDRTQTAATNFYRIKAFAATTQKLSDVIVMNAKNAVRFSISPNPVKGLAFNLQLMQQGNANSFFKLTNAAGQIVFSKELLPANGSTSQNIQLPYSLAKGIYYAVVFNNNERLAQIISIQ